jgi:hypothetical protein
MTLSVANALDRKRLTQIADWAAVGAAVSLPWSTSVTSILLVVWLLTLLPTLNVAMVRREVETAAGGLPVLLWLLAAVGMLWADVSWAERIQGLGCCLCFWRSSGDPSTAHWCSMDFSHRLSSCCSRVGLWC